MTQVLCTQCQKANSETNKFCEQCGAAMPRLAGKKRKAGYRGTEIIRGEVAPGNRVETEILTELEGEASPAKKSRPYRPTVIERADELQKKPMEAEADPPRKREAPETIMLVDFPPAELILETQERLPLQGADEYFVGRGDPVNDWLPAVDLAPHGGESGGVSRKHARFYYAGGRCTLADLDSKNGTYINDKKLTPRQGYPLTEGDRLRFGRIQLTFRLIPNAA